MHSFQFYRIPYSTDVRVQSKKFPEIQTRLPKKIQNEILFLTELFFYYEIQFYINVCHLQIEKNILYQGDFFF